jgi:leucyl-tRNA synthetase
LRSKFLADEGITKAREPFSSLLTQGLVQGRTNKSAEDGRYLRPAEIDVLKDEKGVTVHIEKRNGRPTLVTWEKMSKSKHNGIAPEDIVREHGADVARAFVLFKVGGPDATSGGRKKTSAYFHERKSSRVMQLVSFIFLIPLA